MRSKTATLMWRARPCSLRVALALVISSLFLAGSETVRVSASPGDLDISFGDGGLVLTDFVQGAENHTEAIAIQPDGKIVVAGSTLAAGGSGVIARFNPDGTLDTSFGKLGKATISYFDGITAIIVQPDGKLVAGSSSQFGGGMARLNYDGSLDLSFGHEGIAWTYVSISALAMQPDGKMLGGGSTQGYRINRAAGRFGLTRVNADGNEDLAFGYEGVAEGGFLSAKVTSLAVQRDGKIVMAGGADVKSTPGGDTGRVFAMARFNINGSMDAGFGTSGFVNTQFSSADVLAAVLLDDGRILAVGRDVRPGGNFIVAARYEIDGTLDKSFATEGKLALPFFVADQGQVEAISVAPNGDFVAAGRAVDGAKGGPAGLALARYRSDGSPEAGFGIGGRVVTRIGDQSDHTARALAFQSDGRIVVAGDSGAGQLALARYQSADQAAGPTFTLFFSESLVRIPRGTKVRVPLEIRRNVGFAGAVTITAPDTSAMRLKVTPDSVTTTDGSVSFKIKAKGNAPVGTLLLTFTGKDDAGAVRSAKLSVSVE